MKRSAASDSLVLPELIEGAWTSLVILTYSSDLTFFESQLMRQLSQVPLRIVLADSVRLTAQLTEAVATGRTHQQANRSYLIAPIRHLRAAHAKVILMTGAKAGRLLVGSGNLGQSGYATPGELWHVFGYDESNDAFLDEFAAVRRLIDAMATAQLIDPPVCEALNTTWNLTPWLPRKPSTTTRVRDNRDQPLATQFIDTVAAAGQAVRELTVHAPFYDADARALRVLIKKLAPQHVRVLLRRDTSVNPRSLVRALAAAASSQLLEVSVTDDDDTFLHAKWIHAATADNDIVLTGSPNLSGVALLSDWTDGNIEAGVIQVLPAGSLDALYNPLTLTPISRIADWNLHRRTTPAEPEPAGPRLLWSQLRGQQLILAFTAAFDESTLTLAAADGTALETVSAQWHGLLLTLTLTADQVDGLVNVRGPIGVRLGEGSKDGADDSAVLATWPYQLEQLASRLKTADANRMLDKVGSLPEADKELYELLAQLEQSLLFDPQTAWKAVNRDASPPTENDGTGPAMRWEDIDWLRLEGTPNFTAYHYLTDPGIARTDIEVILASISAQVGRLPDPPGAGLVDDSDLAVESSELLADPELAEDREVEGEWRADDLAPRMAISTRTRMAFGRFFKRLQAAMASDQFVARLGPTITLHNAVILHHILNQVLARDGIDPLTAVDAHLAIWGRLWGDGTEIGLIAGLDSDERAAADDLIGRGGLRESALVALAGYPHYATVLEKRRSQLRAVAQHLACDEVFALDADLCLASAPEHPLELMERAWTLASRLEDWEVRAFVLAPLGLASTAGRWDSVPVIRSGFRVPRKVKILAITQTVPSLDVDAAVAALQRLVLTSSFDDEAQDYWRISFTGNRVMCFWDGRARKGMCVAAGEEMELDSLELLSPAWWVHFEKLHAALLAETAAETA